MPKATRHDHFHSSGFTGAGSAHRVKVAQAQTLGGKCTSAATAFYVLLILHAQRLVCMRVCVGGAPLVDDDCCMLYCSAVWYQACGTAVCVHQGAVSMQVSNAMSGRAAITASTYTTTSGERKQHCCVDAYKIRRLFF